MVVVVHQALHCLAAHRPGIDNRAFDSAKQAVRECGKRGRGRRTRLHLRAPCAQQEPQRGQRQPCDALGAQSRHTTERGHQRQCNKDLARSQPESFGDCNAGGKEPGRVKERDGGRTGALSGAEAG
jgi:hypothetical protein